MMSIVMLMMLTLLVVSDDDDDYVYYYDHDADYFKCPRSGESGVFEQMVKH